MRRLLWVAVFGVLAGGIACAQEAPPSSDEVLARCPTAARLINSDQAGQVRDPVFTDITKARSFAALCHKAVRELDQFPLMPSDLAEIRTELIMDAEFLTGDVYLMSTSQVPSVVKLRTWVKIPPPEGFVYVKKYPSGSKMPAPVADAFSGLSNRADRARVQGVTMRGRFVALLPTEFHDELEDNLGHELVHAYITLASPRPLPTWFQEGAAVYFSTGRDTKLYGEVGKPVMKEISLPEDYKTRLHSFQYIEDTVGRDKLFLFVRKSVETGNPDAREALGLSNPPEKFVPPIRQIIVAIIGIAVVFGGAWYISHRREMA